MTNSSPLITSFSWGKVVVENQIFKDVILFPGGATQWDWSLTGTSHRPGIQVADLEHVLPYEPEVVLLSRGVDLVLQVPEQTVQALVARGIEPLVEQSEALVKLYNDLVHQGARVAALLHSTC
jgi:hypothetical protein